MPAAQSIDLTGWSPASSGSSSETWLFTLLIEQNGGRTEHPLVLRTNRDGRGLFPDYDFGLQAQVMRALGTAGLPVPAIRWYEADGKAIGAAFIIMDQVEGDTPSDTSPGFHGHGLFHDADAAGRRSMWIALVQKLVDLHRLDWRAMALPPLVGAAESVAACMAQHLALLDRWIAWSQVPPAPALLRALDWLRRTPPPSGQGLALLWGDGRPGNALYRDQRITAMLDWELASIGLPAFDLGYLIWSAEVLRQVNDVPWLEGVPRRDACKALYCALSGAELDCDYGEVFALARLAVMTALGGRQAGHDPYFQRFLRESVVVQELDRRFPA